MNDLHSQGLNRERFLWGMALLGQFIFIFSVVALSGPGRIDIDDGQQRFEVAQSIVDHGDTAIRDPGITFGVLPGRNGQRHSRCRLPQIAAGVAAIKIADVTGPARERRRHFFFLLTSAFACAVLALTYSTWFRFLGHSPLTALCWSFAGIFCTPSWFYATSTFDDILGTSALVLAVTAAFITRQRFSLVGAAIAGLALGLAFNCKQPLGIFGLAVAAANYDCRIPWRKQLIRQGLIAAGLLLGIAVYLGYEYYNFPPETRAAHEEILKQWGKFWPGNPLAAFLALTLSPGAGALWYCPTLLLSFKGLAQWCKREKFFWCSVLGASTVFLVFLCWLNFFKGDVAWGPRYLTPIFGLLWIFVPTSVAFLRRRLVALLLILGFLVQLLALSVEPHRLYLDRGLWSRFYVEYPWIYFDPSISHLCNRPREILEVLMSDDRKAETFTSARSPTYALPILEKTLYPGENPFYYRVVGADSVGLGAFPSETGSLSALAIFATGKQWPANQLEAGRIAVRRYYIYDSFRPWWICQRFLSPAERPVALWPTVEFLVAGVAGGLALILLGTWTRYSRISLSPS